jgi:hypothetical protein
LPQQPVALPPILTEASRADGFRNLVWVARPLKPGEKTMIERTLLDLQTRDVPAAVNAIRFHVGKTLSHWDRDNGRLTMAEKQAIIADWEYLLRDFAEGHIAEACAEWVTESRFKPVPADIIAICRNIQARDRESMRRARVLLGMESPRRWEQLPAPPKKLVERPTEGLLASLSRKLRSAPPPPAANRKTIEADLASRDPQAVEKLAAMRKTTA